MWKIFIVINGNKYPLEMESPYETEEEVEEALHTLRRAKGGALGLEGGDWIGFSDNCQFFFIAEKQKG